MVVKQTKSKTPTQHMVYVTLNNNVFLHVSFALQPGEITDPFLQKRSESPLWLGK